MNPKDQKVPTAPAELVPPTEPRHPKSGKSEDGQLDVRVEPIKTEGSSQNVCHNPCM